MAGKRRTLDRKALRAEGDAAERRKDEDVEETDEEEEEDEDGEEDAEAAEDDDAADDDDSSGDDDDEDAPKKKKPKKKVAVKKAPAKPRSRAAKVVRMRVVWGVFSNSHQCVEEFPYPNKKDAEELAAKYTADKKSGHPFFLQPVKKPFDKE